MAPHRSDATIDALAAEASAYARNSTSRPRRSASGSASRACCRTPVNAGTLSPADREPPADEVYPVHTFPALVTLLERRTPYCFGLGDRIDVSSASLAALLGKETQAAAPITVRGEVWGSLWVATLPGDRPLAQADLPRIVRGAHEVARLLTALLAAD
jgi:hypothetical protein